MTFSLVMLCLNEMECLKVILPQIDLKWVDEALIIDGGSTDGSIEFAQSLGFTVIRQKGKGLLSGVKEGIEAAKSDVIIGFTPDGNMLPERIPELVAKMKEGYEMVICSRYYKGAKSYDDSAISGFGNWMFTKMVNILFKADYTDVLGYYRAYKKDLIPRLGLEVKLSIDTQLCIRCAKRKLKVAEISGDEPRRIAGNSSRSIIRNGLIELSTILGEFFIK